MDTLPDVVIINICSWLDGASFSFFTSTCRKLRPFIKNESHWKSCLKSTFKLSTPLYFESTDENDKKPRWRGMYIDTANHERKRWKLSQVFGEDPASVNEENVITSVEFDNTGDYLSIGYQCGQVVIFRKTNEDTFKFHTQFESHHPEFDFLTSLEIEEKITKIRWLKNTFANNSRMVLTSNDKTVKLYKIGEKAPKKFTNFGMPNPLSVEPQNNKSIGISLKKVFGNAHAYNINSITTCSDGKLFMTGDDLRINLWDLENNKECYTIVDKKPANMSDLNEVLTATRFHPIDPNEFVYSSSKGNIYHCDMRQRSLCDQSAKIFKEKEPPASFFSEVTSSFSDIEYSSDGRFIVSRDYLQVKVWDTKMEAGPVKVFDVNEHLKSKLYELYDNDRIFDKFEICRSSNDLHFMTGSYSNNFMIFDVATSKVKYMQAVNPRDRKKRKAASLPTTEDIDFSAKIQHVAWNPKVDISAVTAGNYIYLYHTTK